MKVLVFGAAGGVWEEVAAAKELTSFDVVVAVKRVGYEYPEHIDHWVSFHAAMFPDWIIKRQKKGYPECPNYWTSTYKGNVRYRRGETKYPNVHRVVCEGGSSGLIGVMVALKVSPNPKIVLAGIPMDPDRGHFNKKGPWHEAVKHRKAWETYLPDLKDNVRSLSGWTQQLLGAPTKEWLNG